MRYYYCSIARSLVYNTYRRRLLIVGRGRGVFVLGMANSTPKNYCSVILILSFKVL